MDVLQLVQTKLLEYQKQNKDMEFFLGGSRRFGYHNEGSDYDFFIYLPKVGDVLSVELYFARFFGATSVRSSQYQGKHYRARVLGTQVDLILYGDKPTFDVLLLEHEKLSSFLENQPTLVHYLTINDVGRDDVSHGAFRYRALVKVMEVAKISELGANSIT